MKKIRLFIKRSQALYSFVCQITFIMALGFSGVAMAGTTDHVPEVIKAGMTSLAFIEGEVSSSDVPVRSESTRPLSEAQTTHYFYSFLRKSAELIENSSLQQPIKKDLQDSIKILLSGAQIDFLESIPSPDCQLQRELFSTFKKEFKKGRYLEDFYFDRFNLPISSEADQFLCSVADTKPLDVKRIITWVLQPFEKASFSGKLKKKDPLYFNDAQLIKRVSLPSAKMKIEVGAGSDPLCQGIDLQFVDASRSEIKETKAFFLRKNLSVPLVQADATRLPFRDESIGRITSKNFIWFFCCCSVTLQRPSGRQRLYAKIDFIRQVLTEYQRVLSPGGEIILVQGMTGKKASPIEIFEHHRMVAEYFGLEVQEFQTESYVGLIIRKPCSRSSSQAKFCVIS